MIKALVSGCAGFIDSHDVNALIAREELGWIPKVSIKDYLNEKLRM